MEALRRDPAKKFQRFLELSQVLKGYSLFVTEGGYIGVVLGAATVGDSICVVDGSCVPLILRELVDTSKKAVPPSEARTHRLVGTAYVHGVMDGEISKAVERGEEKKDVIYLV